MQNVNQFSQSPEQGYLDLRGNNNVLTAQIDAAETETIVAGQALKMVDNAGGVPKLEVAGQDDAIFGFACANFKKSSYVAEDALEVAYGSGSVMYMTAGAAIARDAEVMISSTEVKVLTAAVGSHRIVGRALDKAAADGDLIRVSIYLPGALTAAS